MDIVGLILEVAIEGATKGRIMDKAYLTVLQAEGLSILVIGKWITMLWERYWQYKTTEKGLRMLAVYNDIN